jgi:hypothetical protein
MIANYNAGTVRCLDDLIESAASSGLKVDKDNFKAFIKRFHAFLNKDLFDILYISPKADYLASCYAGLKLNDAHIALAYQETSDCKEVVKVGSNR